MDHAQQGSQEAADPGRSAAGTITPGRFVWHELVTQDPGKSIAFYSELFGWRVDQSDASYPHIFAGDVPIGGVLKAPTARIPTHWLPYVSVADVEATEERAVAAGCTVLAPTMSIADVGTFAVLKDAQGALFSAWRSKRGDPPELTDRPTFGTFCWDQLNTPDADGAFATYGKIFDWQRVASPSMPGLFTLLRGARSAAGLMQGPAGMPAHWLSYVAVEQLETTRSRARQLGGKVMVERIEVPSMGAFCVLQDTLGAMIAAFAPS